MKKILLALLPLLPIAAAAQQAYVLKGNVPAAVTPAKAYLFYQNDKGDNVFDSATVEKGLFEFHGNIDKARKGALLLAYKPVKFKYFMEVLIKLRDEEDFKNESLDMLNFYLEPGSIALTSKDSLFRATVSGSALNKDLSVLNQQRAPVYQAMKFVIYRFNELARENNFTEEDILKLETNYRKSQDQLKQVELTFVKQHPAAMVSLNLLDKYLVTESANTVTGPLFKAFSPALRQSPEGKAMAEKIQEFRLVDIGAMAPDFSEPDVNGKIVSLSAYRGKYVLVDFWASWCGPCRADNPAVIYSYKTYKDKNFTVLGVSLDKEAAKSKWLEAIAQEKIGDWSQVCDGKGMTNAAAVLYHVSNIPQNFLIGPDGKIVAKNLHGNALPEKLATLIH